MNKNHGARRGLRRRQRKPGRHRKARRALQAARQRLVYVLDARYRAMTAQHAAGQRQRYPKDLDWAGIEEAAAVTDNPSDLFEALESGEVSGWWMHREWWQAPRFVPKNVWQGAYIKNRNLWRNGVCLESQHQKLAIKVSDLLEWLERKEAAAVASTEQGKSFTEKAIETSTKQGDPTDTQAGAVGETVSGAQKERKKRQPAHDWGAAILFLEQEWKKHGDPDLPKNRFRKEDKWGKWESDSDIGWRIRKYLETLDPDRDPPEHRSVMRIIKPELERLRAENGQT